MTYIRYLPAPPLSDYIEDFYYLDGPAPYPRQKALPVASSNLMINLGQSFDVYRPDQEEPFITCTDSWWVGVWDTYHSVDWPSNVRLYGVHFKPGGAYPFLRFPLSEMNSQVVPLDAMWGLHAFELRERLHAAQTVKAGFTLLERQLLVRLREAPHTLQIIHHAVTEIAQLHGALAIRELSEQMGMSQNHQSHFYDQSHLNRDFLAFTGHSPTQYVKLRRRVEAENPEHARAYRNLPID